MSRPATALLTLALVPLLGCEPPGGAGTDSGNAFRAELTVAGEGALVSSARDIASLSRADLLLNEVELRPCGGGGDDELDYEGDYTSDLLAGTDLGAIDLSIDSVCRVEVEAENEPSIVIEGVSSGGLPFVITSDKHWEFRIDSDLDLGADALNRLALLFDLDVWLAGVDPDLGAPGNDGVVRIEDGVNDGLLDLFEDNVETTGRLDREDD